MRTETIRVLVVPPSGAAREETIAHTLASFEAQVEGKLDAFSLGIEGTVCFCKRGHFARIVPGCRAIYGTFLVMGDDEPECCDLTDAQIAQARELLGGAAR